MDYTGLIPAHIKLYIFDLDGTLVDSLSDLSASVNAMLSLYGLPVVDEGIVRRGIGIGARNLLYRCFAAAAKNAGTDCPPRISATGIGSDPDPLTANDRAALYPAFEALIAEAMPEYRRLYIANSTARTVWYPGILNWLETLTGQGLSMAILSNKPDTASARIIRALGGDRFFRMIEGPESVGALKPDPAGIHKIMKRCGISAAETVMIGDSTVDIETGKNAGVLTCGITGGYGDDASLRRAACDVLIERV